MEHGMDSWHCVGSGERVGNGMSISLRRADGGVWGCDVALCICRGKEEGDKGGEKETWAEVSFGVGALGSCAVLSAGIRGETFSFLSSRSKKEEVYQPRQVNWGSLS